MLAVLVCPFESSHKYVQPPATSQPRDRRTRNNAGTRQHVAKLLGRSHPFFLIDPCIYTLYPKMMRNVKTAGTVIRAVESSGLRATLPRVVRPASQAVRTLTTRSVPRARIAVPARAFVRQYAAEAGGKFARSKPHFK